MDILEKNKEALKSKLAKICLEMQYIIEDQDPENLESEDYNVRVDLQSHEGHDYKFKISINEVEVIRDPYGAEEPYYELGDGMYIEITYNTETQQLDTVLTNTDLFHDGLVKAVKRGIKKIAEYLKQDETFKL